MRLLFNGTANKVEYIYNTEQLVCATFWNTMYISRAAQSKPLKLFSVFSATAWNLCEILQVYVTILSILMCQVALKLKQHSEHCLMFDRHFMCANCWPSAFVHLFSHSVTPLTASESTELCCFGEVVPEYRKDHVYSKHGVCYFWTLWIISYSFLLKSRRSTAISWS